MISYKLFSDSELLGPMIREIFGFFDRMTSNLFGIKDVILWSFCFQKKATVRELILKNSIRDVRTPQPGEIVFNTMKYRSSETVQRSGYFQSSVSYIELQIMFK